MKIPELVTSDFCTCENGTDLGPYAKHSQDVSAKTPFQEVLYLAATS